MNNSVQIGNRTKKLSAGFDGVYLIQMKTGTREVTDNVRGKKNRVSTSINAAELSKLKKKVFTLIVDNQ